MSELKSNEHGFKDLFGMSQSIVTKEMQVTERLSLRVRAYLNTIKVSKRGQMCSTVIQADTLDFEYVEQVHAFAAWTLSSSLGWNDTDLIPIQLNRLGKQNDSGKEMIWINKSGASLNQILKEKSYWFDPEWKKEHLEESNEVEVSLSPETVMRFEAAGLQYSAPV